MKIASTYSRTPEKIYGTLFAIVEIILILVTNCYVPVVIFTTLMFVFLFLFVLKNLKYLEEGTYIIFN